MKYSIIRGEPPQGQEFTQPSQTVPNETMSIRDMLNRHVRGLQVSGRVISDENFHDYPVLEEMELTDRMDVISKNADELKKLSEKQRLTNKERERLAIIAEYEKQKAEEEPKEEE